METPVPTATAEVKSESTASSNVTDTKSEVKTDNSTASAGEVVPETSPGGPIGEEKPVISSEAAVKAETPPAPASDADELRS